MHANLSPAVFLSPRSKSEGSDDVFYTRSQENVLLYENKVFRFIRTAEQRADNGYLSPPLLRSNSFTSRDTQENTSTLQVPENSYFIKGRRMSMSLPELRNMPFLRAYSEGNIIPNSSLSEFNDIDDDSESYIADIPTRKIWSTKADFIFSSLGFTVGLNCFWRFPYFCYENGGGSFLVAYLILLVFFGVPLLCMEYSVGQLTHSGHSIFGTLCPILKGTVISAAFANCLIVLVYGTVNSWAMFYFFKSFATPSWSKCSHQWNSNYCRNGSDMSVSRELPVTSFNNTEFAFNKSDGFVKLVTLTNNNSFSNITQFSMNSSYYSSQEFFDRRLLSLSFDTSGLGVVRWELAVMITIIWVTVFVALKKNIHLSSHSTYALAILPFTLIVILFLRTLMLSDMKSGLMYFFKPTSKGMMKPETWLYATSLCIHSLGSVLGTSIASAKCNKEKNNFLRDAFIICIMNIFVAIAFGSVVFGTLGYLSKKRGVPISSVVTNEPGLAFVVYSEHLLTMPFKSVWSAVFFLLMFCGGIDYQIAIVSTLLTTLEEMFSEKIKERFFSPQFFRMIVCVVLLSLNFLLITQNGIMVVITIEKFITVWLTVVLAFFEVILIGWFYGGTKLSQIIKLKTSKALGCYLPFCWNTWIPVVLMGIIMVNAIFNDELEFRGLRHFFVWRLIGLVLLLTGLVILPITAVIEVIRTPKTTLITRILNACKPKNENVELTTVIYGNDPSFWRQDQQTSNFPKIEFFKDDANVNPVTFSRVAGLDRETTI